MPRVDDQHVGPAIQAGKAFVHVFQVLAELGQDVQPDRTPGPRLLELPRDDLAYRDRRAVRIAQALEPPITTRESSSCPGGGPGSEVDSRGSRGPASTTAPPRPPS